MPVTRRLPDVAVADQLTVHVGGRRVELRQVLPQRDAMESAVTGSR